MRTKVEYDGKIIAFTEGEVLDIRCAGEKMKTDLHIEVNGEGGGIVPSGALGIVENGTYDVTEYAAAIVTVSPKLQEKTVTANGEATPDAGFDGLSKVIVNIPECTHTVYDGAVTIS